MRGLAPYFGADSARGPFSPGSARGDLILSISRLNFLLATIIQRLHFQRRILKICFSYYDFTERFDHVIIQSNLQSHISCSKSTSVPPNGGRTFHIELRSPPRRREAYIRRLPFPSSTTKGRTRTLRATPAIIDRSFQHPKTPATTNQPVPGLHSRRRRNRQ